MSEMPTTRDANNECSKTYSNVDVVALNHHTFKGNTPVVSLTGGNIDPIDITGIDGRVYSAGNQHEHRFDLANLPKGQ